jgi:hypothetical protein
MAEEAKVIEKIKSEGQTEAVSSFNLFQTPKALAQKMADMMGDLDGQRCLEPSAGLGRLYKACDGGDWLLVEQSNDLCRHLYELGVKLINDDFLLCSEERLGGQFDRIIMNPPFQRGTDIRHITHAKRMLKPGGLLVALCYNGVRQNQHLRAIADTWEVLPENTFRSEGTAASVVLLTIRA